MLNLKTNLKVKTSKEVLYTKIIAYLKEFGYKITEANENMVAFSDDEFREKPATRSDYYTRIAEGKIALATDGDEITLHFFYKIAVFWELLILSVITVLSFSMDYAIIIIGTLVLINFICKLVYLKFSLIEDIINIE